MIKLFFISLLLLSGQLCTAQDKPVDFGNVNIHIGTIAVYSTYSIGYESFDLLPATPKHALRLNGGLGFWSASLFNKNTGFQTNISAIYGFGQKKHLLDLGFGAVFHSDKSLKGEGLSYIGTLYRPYIGYRFQPHDKRIILKIGSGWREVIQLGLGWRI